ncbi:MAG TPA: PmoA family protein [Rubrobacter sp.]|nr:PmoA family protein [Rubrobacter sp.]
MTLRLMHALGESVEARDGRDLLFRYVYEARVDASESPKPYFHPLRTLAGEEVTLFRPHDHPWHTGLAMTSAYLSGENFWGGPTYVRGKGYQWLENQGMIRHDDWCEIRGEGSFLKERLSWISHGGETWIEEERGISVGGIYPSEGFWSLDLSFRLKNVTERSLTFGSPTTEGRPAAGYGGLFWRGPRSFDDGEILAADGLEGPETMGRTSPWLAYIGLHDGTGRASTVLFLDSPTNVRFPGKWFVRNDPYACASCSFMFDEEYVLEPEEELALDYRVVLGDGRWSRERIEEYVDSIHSRVGKE